VTKLAQTLAEDGWVCSNVCKDLPHENCKEIASVLIWSYSAGCGDLAKTMALYILAELLLLQNEGLKKIFCIFGKKCFR